MVVWSKASASSLRMAIAERESPFATLSSDTEPLWILVLFNSATERCVPLGIHAMPFMRWTANNGLSTGMKEHENCSATRSRRCSESRAGESWEVGEEAGRGASGTAASIAA